jgi:hypothetical protein
VLAGSPQRQQACQPCLDCPTGSPPAVSPSKHLPTDLFPKRAFTHVGTRMGSTILLLPTWALARHCHNYDHCPRRTVWDRAGSCPRGQASAALQRPVAHGWGTVWDRACSYPRGHSPASSQCPSPTGHLFGWMDPALTHVGTPRLPRNYDHCPPGRAPHTGSSLLLPTGARLGFVATTRCRRGGRPIRDRACSYPRGHSSTSSQLRPLRARGTVRIESSLLPKDAQKRNRGAGLD